jgi:hypothetical protein
MKAYFTQTDGREYGAKKNCDRAITTGSTVVVDT